MILLVRIKKRLVIHQRDTNNDQEAGVEKEEGESAVSEEKWNHNEY